MSSVIGGMEDTIAQTMAQIGWPGADLVNEPGEVEPEAEAVQEPPAQPYGVRACPFRDPAGNLVRIQQLGRADG